MKSFEKKDSLIKSREAALKKNLKKRKKLRYKTKKKRQYFQINGLEKLHKKKR